MNMFKPTSATSTEEYLAMLPEERREALLVIDKLIKKTAPSLKPHFANNMLGYGRFTYTTSKKETGDWPVIALASQKNYISMYVCAVDDKEYIAEKYKDALGKVSVGRSCIRFKKVEDLNLETIKKVIQYAQQSPGLVSASKAS